MARRISGEGLVTVSLRRSITMVGSCRVRHAVLRVGSSFEFSRDFSVSIVSVLGDSIAKKSVRILHSTSKRSASRQPRLRCPDTRDSNAFQRAIVNRGIDQRRSLHHVIAKSCLASVRQRDDPRFMPQAQKERFLQRRLCIDQRPRGATGRFALRTGSSCPSRLQ